MSLVITDMDRLEVARCVRAHCGCGPGGDAYVAGDLERLACVHAASVVFDKARMINLLRGRVAFPKHADKEFEW